MAVRSDGKRAYVSSGGLKGGLVAVIDVARDEVVRRVKVGTGGVSGIPGQSGGSANGLATDPFWWFER